MKRTELVRFTHPTSCRLGMTLVELLIVVAVLLILMSVSIPLMRPALQQDKVREASRQVNGFIAGAQMRAIERGRPVGVWLQRSPNPDMAVELFYAESPPPYSGDITDAFATLVDISGDSIVDAVEFDPVASSLVTKVVKVNDLIRLDNKSTYYTITSIILPPLRTYPTLTIQSSVGVPMPPLHTPPAVVRYQILRQPIKRNYSHLQLTGGTTIDLRNSGVGSDGFEFRYAAGAADHVVFAFGPNGGLDYLFYGTSAQTFYGPVHLLVGRVDKMVSADADASNPNPISVSATSAAATETYNQNIADQSNLWVTINKYNGTTTTAENAWVLNPPSGWSGTPGPPYYMDSLRAAREFAHMGRGMGGR